MHQASTVQPVSMRPVGIPTPGRVAASAPSRPSKPRD
jgi:hypothetical protein